MTSYCDRWMWDKTDPRLAPATRFHWYRAIAIARLAVGLAYVVAITVALARWSHVWITIGREEPNVLDYKNIDNGDATSPPGFWADPQCANASDDQLLRPLIAPQPFYVRENGCFLVHWSAGTVIVWVIWVVIVYGFYVFFAIYDNWYDTSDPRDPSIPEVPGRTGIVYLVMVGALYVGVYIVFYMSVYRYDSHLCLPSVKNPFNEPIVDKRWYDTDYQLAVLYERLPDLGPATVERLLQTCRGVKRFTGFRNGRDHLHIDLKIMPNIEGAVLASLNHYHDLLLNWVIPIVVASLLVVPNQSTIDQFWRVCRSRTYSIAGLSMPIDTSVAVHANPSDTATAIEPPIVRTADDSPDPPQDEPTAKPSRRWLWDVHAAACRCCIPLPDCLAPVLQDTIRSYLTTAVFPFHQPHETRDFLTVITLTYGLWPIVILGVFCNGGWTLALLTVSLPCLAPWSLSRLRRDR